MKLDKNFLDWEWWGDINTSRLFLYMLLRANTEDGKYRGLPVPKGCLVSSVSKMSRETNLTEHEIRTALAHLQETKDVERHQFLNISIYKIKNYR